MFNWFGNSTVRDRMKEVEETYLLPKKQNWGWSEDPSKNGYEVSMTSDGETVLKMYAGGNAISLTMNKDGCEELIKKLQKTIEK